MPEESVFQWTAFGGRLHPLLLHLPIGLLAGVVTLEVASWLPGEQRGGVRVARRVLALLGALTAAVAALSGWWLAEEGGYDAELLDDHRWLAIGFAVVFALAALLERRQCPPLRERLRRGALVLAGALVAVAGHHGGMLSHGSTFLSSRAPDWLAPFVGPEGEAPQVITADTDGDSLGARALAALNRRCVECHGPKQQKGGLRLDVEFDLMTVVEPGNAPASELMRRVLLPPSHPDFMPSEGEPLSDNEVLVLRDWINAGAPLEAIVSARVEVEQVQQLHGERLAALVLATGASIAPIDPHAPTGLLVVDFGSSTGPVDADMLRALAELAGEIGELSLAGRDLEPGICEVLPLLPALQVLRLERASSSGAPIGDREALLVLERTPALEKLVLHTTAIGDAVLERAATLEHLAQIYVADTQVSADALAALHQRRPDLVITGAATLVEDPLAFVPRHVLAADASKGRMALLREIGVGTYDVVWERSTQFLHDLALLADGHVLYQETATRLVEWDPASDAVVWSYEAATTNRSPNDGRIEVHSFGRLEDGTTYIAESGAQRIIIVDQGGRLVHTIPLTVANPDPHRDTRLVRPTDKGTFLVAHEGDGVVREYDRSGHVVWSFDVPLTRDRAPGHGPEAYGNQVFGAQRLPDGNTLIATGNGHAVLEVAPSGEIVWQLGQSDLEGLRLAWVTTVQVLGNGNLVVNNCHGGDGTPQLVEITRDRHIVWRFENRDLFGDALSNAWIVEDSYVPNRPPSVVDESR